MTHEELLANISYIQVEFWNRINRNDSELLNAGDALSALRAVVELAITAVNGNPNTAYSMGYAAACERIIQAIEKELG